MSEAAALKAQLLEADEFQRMAEAELGKLRAELAASREALQEAREFIRTAKFKFESITPDYPNAATINVWISERDNALRRVDALAVSQEENE
jgi:hypothetical protein